MKPLLMAIALCIAAGAAQAADPCKAQRTTSEIEECAKLTLARNDKALNAAYQKLMSGFAATDKSDTTNYDDVKKLLQQAQREWLLFRDADCKAKLRFYEGGSIQGIVHINCINERTDQRTKELLKWIEG